MVLFVYLVVKKQIRTLYNPKAFKYILGVTLFIVIIPSVLIYFGASHTSGVNTAILLQTEILFTFLIVGVFTRERITLKKISGALLVAFGAVIILYNGDFSVNSADLLIIAGAAFYPLGNICAKKALELATPVAILFIRAFVGGNILLLISLLFENYTLSVSHYISDNFLFLAANGVFIYCVSKLLWYEGLKRMDITKAIPLGMTYPAFSLVYAYFLLREIPTFYQLLGFIVIFSGVFFLIKKGKKTIELTI